MAAERRPAWWRNSRGEWFLVVQAFLFALVAAAPIWWPLSLELPAPLRFLAAAGGVLGGILGGILALAGLVSLGRSLSALPHPKENATLVETGVYGIVRHPIYSGVILGALGWALLFASVTTLALAGLLIVFFDIKSRREERWLARKFPAYAAYQQRVAKLIPYIY